MNALLGRKVGMTRVTDKHGRLIAATVIQAEANAVTAVRTVEKNGYAAVQLGYGNPKKVAKPQQGQLAKANASVGRHMFEVRVDGDAPELGSDVTVSIFTPGDVVNVIGTSKGHGFTGTVKRHNFTIGPRSHGSMNKREPGSIGAQQPQRVIPGKKMAGHMGNVRTTVKHLEVLDILPEQNLIVLRGSVPGVKGALVRVTKSPRHASDDQTKDAA